MKTTPAHATLRAHDAAVAAALGARRRRRFTLPLLAALGVLMVAASMVLLILTGPVLTPPAGCDSRCSAQLDG